MSAKKAPFIALPIETFDDGELTAMLYTTLKSDEFQKNKVTPDNFKEHTIFTIYLAPTKQELKVDEAVFFPVFNPAETDSLKLMVKLTDDATYYLSDEYAVDDAVKQILDKLDQIKEEALQQFINKLTAYFQYISQEYKYVKIKNATLKDGSKQHKIIDEALESGKSVGQVKFYAVDNYDNEYILNGMIFDEKKKLWIEIDTNDEVSDNWNDALVFYAGKMLVIKQLTCKFAVFGKEITTEMIAKEVPLDEVIELCESQGFKISRITEKEKEQD